MAVGVGFAGELVADLVVAAGRRLPGRGRGASTLRGRQVRRRHQTAVWRIENGTPRRRINLDEALAFTRVFELPLEELMSPPLEGLDIDSRRLVQEAVEAFYETRDARDRLHRAVVAIADHIKAHPDSSRAIHEQCLRLMGDERDARTLSNDIEDGGHY
ncbi:XRE family transcriptional regulator [Streptomyces albidoflavus]|uniref:XRE family transcriptional regulator n=1 Tax=Streptomyces albidoflavus TaxID=1886 RepID=UPI00397772F8